jgi:hypothetical protein
MGAFPRGRRKAGMGWAPPGLARGLSCASRVPTLRVPRIGGEQANAYAEGGNACVARVSAVAAALDRRRAGACLQGDVYGPV